MIPPFSTAHVVMQFEQDAYGGQLTRESNYGIDPLSVIFIGPIVSSTNEFVHMFAACQLFV